MSQIWYDLTAPLVAHRLSLLSLKFLFWERRIDQVPLVLKFWVCAAFGKLMQRMNSTFLITLKIQGVWSPVRKAVLRSPPSPAADRTSGISVWCRRDLTRLGSWFLPCLFSFSISTVAQIDLHWCLSLSPEFHLPPYCPPLIDNSLHPPRSLGSTSAGFKQPQMERYPKQFPEVSKMQNLNLLPSNCLHCIYIILDMVSTLEVI